MIERGTSFLLFIGEEEEIVVVDLYWLPGAFTHEQAYERGAKRLIEDRVNNGVDCGGDVAEPEADVHHVVGHRAIRTRSEENVEEEKRRPAENECEEH